ncbi:Putative aminoglycoside phosphotransferase [Roseovarius litorisediminis]|uniref:Putative aminoglycoside phosphotransferase n=1 Tax=Roseovarius litorisediminis TaxID=1312363 RepID=A0A1Y5RTA7_9RHOB|nr:phosphotransferase family protein [Roseovarius litorisediminis]SLN23745.1 Putative aminoglycoside phosphotransferase [Roseovarius litorisediminis]
MSDTQLDTAAVSAWVAGRLPGFDRPVTATKFSGGQSNPTYRLQTRSGNYVLRRKPPGVLLKSAHAVDREFRVQQALADTDVPVARVHLLCEDDNVIGAAFYLMDEVPGRNFDQPSLPDLDPTERDALMNEMNRVLAAIHNVDIDAVGLSDFGPTGNYYQRQLDRWTKQYHASQTEDLADMTALIDWLDTNMPDDDGQRTLVHGDYRLDNLLFAQNGPDCLAVLDWELSTIGHPYADLAAVIMQWSMPATTEGRGLAGVDREKLGLWSDERFVTEYCHRRGLSGIKRFEFYLAFCYFRMAAILQGVKKRALDGNASDPKRGLQLGAYVPEFARGGLAAAKGIA